MANKHGLKKIKGYLKSISWTLPIAGDYFQKKYLQRQFSTEMELINGNYQSKSNHRSIIHLSVNKAATQYVRNLLRRCATEMDMVCVGLAEYAFHTDFPYLDTLSPEKMREYQYIFRQTGYLYSVFGGMVEGIADLEKYHVILMIRDPRDVLVSEYFSYAYSHSEPSRKGNKYLDFMNMRQKAQHFTVDEYAVSECDRVNKTYCRYINSLLTRYPHVYLTKYEKMTCEFQSWFKELLEYCELNITDMLFKSLLQESIRIQPKQENAQNHIRKGMPGDYKEKLRIETIRYLNSKLSAVLDQFQYPVF